MLSVLAYGGAVWLAVVLVVGGRVRAGGRGRALRHAPARRSACDLGAAGAGLMRGGLNFVNTHGALTGGQLGNLVQPLNGFQLFGIWPAGDFRVNPPAAPALTYVLIAIGDRRWTRRAPGRLAAAVLAAAWLYLAGGAVGIGLVSWKGSPWVQGKAIAIASPAALLRPGRGAGPARESLAPPWANAPGALRGSSRAGGARGSRSAAG